MTDQLTAVHEAGHAACAYLLGACAHAGPITIIPSGGLLGMCFSGHAPLPTEADYRKLGGPYPLLPARLRRRWESYACVMFAGQVAEDAWLARGDVAPLPESSPDSGDEETSEVIALPVRERELLDEAAAADPVSDLTRAWNALVNLHGGDEELTARHVAFLQRETEALMHGSRAGRMVRKLAGELMVHRALPARRWKAILRECP